MTADVFQAQVLQAGFVDKAAQLQSLQQQVSGRSTSDPEVIALQRQLQQMQVHLLFLPLAMLALHDAVGSWWCGAISCLTVCYCINIIWFQAYLSVTDLHLSRHFVCNLGGKVTVCSHWCGWLTLQVASEALALQMQQVQQQVAEGLSAAASLQRDKQAATHQAHQVCICFSVASKYDSQPYLHKCDTRSPLLTSLWSPTQVLLF